MVSDPANPGRLRPVEGTSFAAPAALRTAVGIRAFFGPTLNALTLRALLVHCAIRNIDDKPDEVGWGAIPALTDIITSSDDTARVIYQGTISPASYVRAQIPLPHGSLTGLITVAATLTFVCEVDPQDPATYTRCRFQSRTLHNPTFDIHYLARQGGTSYPRCADNALQPRHHLDGSESSRSLQQGAPDVPHSTPGPQPCEDSHPDLISPCSTAVARGGPARWGRGG